MAVEFKDETIVLTNSIFENELVDIRTFLQEHKSEVTVDCSECKDIHGSVIQLLLAHKATYSAKFTFSEDTKLYQKVIEGFRTVEDDCNK